MRIRLKGMGFPNISSKAKHGHLYAVVELDPPGKLTEEQRKAIEALAEVGL